MARRVAVVGAGYAGMAAAVTLAERGVPVTVLESGPVPGGRARRVLSQGTELDNGQHILIGAYTALFDLMRTVGVPSDALLRLPLELRYPGRFHLRALWLPAPLGLAAGLLAARGVPFAERFGALRFLRLLQREKFVLDHDLPVDALLARHRQDGAIGRYLWRPLCVSALNTPSAIASSRRFLAVLRDTLAGAPDAADLLLPRRDLSALFPEPAAQFVAARGGEIRLKETVRDLAALKEDFSAIIVAVGPHQLKALLPDAPAYDYQPIYTIYLQYPEKTRLPLPMLGLADGLVQWVFDRGALTGERGRLACVISAEGEHQQLSQDELARRCHEELAAVLGGLPAPQWSRVIAEKRATISSLVNPEVVSLDGDRVFLAGDYTDAEYPPTLETAVRSGVRAARRALGEGGFTLIELILMLAVLGVLVAVAIPRFFDLSAPAHKAQVEEHARSFAIAVKLARTRYNLNKAKGAIDNLQGYAGNVLDTNTAGYPVDTNGGNTVTAAGCMRIFPVLIGSKPICGGGTACTSAHDWQATRVTIAGNFQCRYTYRVAPTPARRFDYNPANGDVTVVNP